MSEQDWIAEQKKNRLFRGGGRGNDADRMLEIGGINKSADKNQSMKIIAARTVNDTLGITCIGQLCDMVENAQLIQDGRARSDFMKVAIEQWQGKIASAKNKALEALL